MAAAWGEAVARLQALGGQPVPDFDFAPFAKTAVLLYGAAFVAERYAGGQSLGCGLCSACMPARLCLPTLWLRCAGGEQARHWAWPTCWRPSKCHSMQASGPS